jgi:hypothetical protein
VNDVIVALRFLMAKVERAEVNDREIIAELKLAIDMLHEGRKA